MQTLAAAAQRPGWRRLAGACLLGWHLCSLDAPTVALVWAVVLARLAGVRLQMAELLVLGLGTWIVYVLDRVLDGKMGAGARVAYESREGEPPGMKERHHFHRRHSRGMLGLCCVAAVLLVLLCWRLPSRLVAFYLALAVPVSLYGLAVHGRLLRAVRAARADARKRKEAAVAVLFTAAVAGPALVEAPAGDRPALLVVSVLLAWLCWLNCVVISFAEAEGDGPVVREPARRREWLQLTGCAVGLALAAAALCGWGLGWSPEARSAPAAAAVLLSCLLLLALLLAWREGRVSARRLRVLADLGLLTPLLFLLGQV